MPTRTVQVQTDIKRGEVLENAVRAKLEAQGWHVTHVGGKFHYWDFAINKAGMVAKVEVKHDAMSDQTGRYAIENRWLSHTVASLLIIGTPKEAYMIPVDQVRKLPGREVQMGDTLDNRGKLVEKADLISKAIRFL
jgi:Holliday junction resolvase-like predicted endonuclease